MPSTLQYKIALSLFPRIGSINARKIVSLLGGVEAVFEMAESELRKMPDIGKSLIRTLIDERENVLSKADEEINFIEKYGIKTFFYLDKDYPRRLALCEDSPVILFQKERQPSTSKKLLALLALAMPPIMDASKPKN
jgi:DNA processing protein